MPAAAASTSPSKSGAGDSLGDRFPRALGMQRHPSAEEAVGREIAEDEIGVRYRRLCTTEPVARWAGFGRRALRADAEPAAVDPRDGTAACADRRDVDHRQTQLILVQDRLAAVAPLAAAITRP